MGFDIDTFRAVVQGGFQKPNRYRVFIPIPPIMLQLPFSQQLYETNRYLEFFADAVDFVGAGFATVPIVRYGYGPIQEYVTSTQFPNVAMSFYSDVQDSNLNFFQQWLAITSNFTMVDGVNGIDFLGVQSFENYYKDDYTVDIQVTLMDQNGQDTATWVMREAFVKGMPGPKLSFALNNDVMRVQVLFAYSDWYMDYDSEGSLASELSSTFNTQGTGPGSTGTF